MQRRRAWRGRPPETPDEARRLLLDAARECVERHGASKASLSDVAQAAGVTRQTVYRYFADADDLFSAAAVLASGGFHERLRARVLKRQGFTNRVAETMLLAIREIPDDPHLSALIHSDAFDIDALLRLGFVQEEMIALSDGEAALSRSERDELAELLLRLLHSFVLDPGAERSEKETRALLRRWIAPLIERGA